MLFNDWRRRALLSAAVAASVLLVSCGGESDNPTPIPQFSQAIVVGASVSDTGNACPTATTAGCPPVGTGLYAPGRFSNGNIWIDVLAGQYGASSRASGAGGTNFAVGGARTGSIRAALNAAGLQAIAFTDSTTPSMTAQMDSALARLGFQISPNALVVIDGTAVGNNIAAALALAGANPASATAISTAVVTGAVTDVVGLINRAYAAGARHILVLNAPNLGSTPRVQAAAAAAAAAVIQGGGTADQANAAATQVVGGAIAMSVGLGTPTSPGFNGALAQQIAGLRQLLAGVNLYLLDVAAIETQVKTNAAPAQPVPPALTNVTAPCVVVTPASVCTTPNEYFYWDDFHPTAVVSQYLGARAIALLPTP